MRKKYIQKMISLKEFLDFTNEFKLDPIRAMSEDLTAELVRSGVVDNIQCEIIVRVSGDERESE